MRLRTRLPFATAAALWIAVGAFAALAATLAGVPSARAAGNFGCGTGFQGNCAAPNGGAGASVGGVGAGGGGGAAGSFGGALGAFNQGNDAVRNGTTTLPNCASSEDPLAYGGASLHKDLKDASEMESFMGKHSFVANEGYKTYRPLISAAAKAFNVPEQLLTCILWQESRFNPNAIGPQTKYGHAYGMGQIIEPTMRQIAGVYREGMRDAKGAGEGASAAENDAYASALQRRDTLRVGWPRYFHNLQELVKSGKVRGEPERTAAEKVARESSAGSGDKRHSNLLMEVPRTPPASIEPKDAMNPVIAIAASAQYLRQLMQTLAHNAQDTASEDELLNHPNLAYLGIVAGAYNTGPGNAIKYLKRSGSQSLVGWRNTLMTNSNKETQGYVRNVTNCMEKGLAPQSGMDQTDEEKAAERAKKRGPA